MLNFPTIKAIQIARMSLRNVNLLFHGRLKGDPAVTQEKLVNSQFRWKLVK